MAQTYHCNRHFTEEQREADQDHGILQVQNRTFVLYPTENRFSFAYHYFYEYQNSSYVVVTRVVNDTALAGTYQQEGNKYVAVITEGSQKAEDLAQDKSPKAGTVFTGKIQFLLDGDALKIQNVDLNPPNLTKKDSIIFPNQVFKLQ